MDGFDLIRGAEQFFRPDVRLLAYACVVRAQKVDFQRFCIFDQNPLSEIDLIFSFFDIASLGSGGGVKFREIDQFV